MKKNSLDEPFLSIITVTYNAASVLEATIESLERQSDKDFEYIVIDGASKDDTLQIIAHYSELIDKWITEPDHGIYDAMNKGMELASGRYLWFLNAGDAVFEDNTIAELRKQTRDNPDVLYGESMIVDGERRHMGTRSEITVHTLPATLKADDMKYGMIVCHQSFIPLKTLAPPFIENNLSADIDWVIKILDKASYVKNTSMIFVEYLAGGVSKQKWRRSLHDRAEILSSRFGQLNTFINHFFIVGRAVIHRMARGKRAHY